VNFYALQNTKGIDVLCEEKLLVIKMRKKVSFWATIILVGLVGCLAIYLFGPRKQIKTPDITLKDESSDVTGEDEPAARALYEKMVETMRNAVTLSYKSYYSRESDGREISNCTYTIWMKKPNYFYVETVTSGGRKSGIIVGDGDYLWIYWPDKRPYFDFEETDSYEKTSSNVYMNKAAPVGKHSIGHEFVKLGAGMGMSIIDPSAFHGYTDSLQPYIDWIKSIGTEKVQDEECDVIEVSFMKHQRSSYLWLSRLDHLPRKLKQVVRLSSDIIMHELWTDVTVNAEIQSEKFDWTPPEGWQQWFLPTSQQRLLKPGKEAPDFELSLIDGTKIRLSDYRGKIVWFYMWRAG